MQVKDKDDNGAYTDTNPNGISGGILSVTGNPERDRTMTDQTGFDPGELFLAVEKPSRYTGGEVNAVRKEDDGLPPPRRPRLPRRL